MCSYNDLYNDSITSYFVDIFGSNSYRISKMQGKNVIYTEDIHYLIPENNHNNYISNNCD